MHRSQLVALAGQTMHVSHGSLFVSMHGRWSTFHRHGGCSIKLSASIVFPQSYWKVDSQLNVPRPIVGDRQTLLVESFFGASYGYTKSFGASKIQRSWRC